MIIKEQACAVGRICKQETHIHLCIAKLTRVTFDQTFRTLITVFQDTLFIEKRLKSKDTVSCCG